MKDIQPSFPIQEEGMKDIEAPFPIQEQGDFIDINKNHNHKQDQEQEDAEPPCPPAENKTALPDSQVDLEDGKRWKKKKRKKRKKAHQTPSTFTKRECEWKGKFQQQRGWDFQRNCYAPYTR
ncbi:hypothetical protein AB205_0185510 [Aquarana catesbeiana]|uniref:Uncharacterized protein n=1 Tax=Aquarana catesbeiana TaxID=8400 RepID=A0A2G9RY65_AQUCT|nr:hypothetical protein AB205_0185510 [Aquarana catesbeiana]